MLVGRDLVHGPGVRGATPGPLSALCVGGDRALLPLRVHSLRLPLHHELPALVRSPAQPRVHTAERPQLRLATSRSAALPPPHGSSPEGGGPPQAAACLRLRPASAFRRVRPAVLLALVARGCLHARSSAPQAGVQSAGRHGAVAPLHQRDGTALRAQLLPADHRRRLHALAVRPTLLRAPTRPAWHVTARSCHRPQRPSCLHGAADRPPR